MVFHRMFGYCLQKCGRTVDVSQPKSTSNICECRLKEFIIEGIDNEWDNNQIMDNTQIENCPNTNIGGLDTDDQFTINSEAPFFNCLQHWQCICTPSHVWIFYCPFTAEEFFMIKLFLSETANVSHHIADDIVYLSENVNSKIYLSSQSNSGKEFTLVNIWKTDSKVPFLN